jgi:hypothetical protein
MANIGYNTNLAAECYVLSMMHRLGAEANLTLGNKKSVDIASVRGAGDAITWIIPSADVPPFVYQSPNGKRRVVQLATLNAKAATHKDAWHLLV